MSEMTRYQQAEHEIRAYHDRAYKEAYAAGIAEGERRATAAIVAWLFKGSVWLNGGECCGAKDSDGVCCAPACEWGEELKLLHNLADAISRGDHLPSAGDAGEGA